MTNLIIFPKSGDSLETKISIEQKTSAALFSQDIMDQCVEVYKIRESLWRCKKSFASKEVVFFT
ncbi:hypothetical protein MXB_3046, partial [Myxobolus squamalis]